MNLLIAGTAQVHLMCLQQARTWSSPTGKNYNYYVMTSKSYHLSFCNTFFIFFFYSLFSYFPYLYIFDYQQFTELCTLVINCDIFRNILLRIYSFYKHFEKRVPWNTYERKFFWNSLTNSYRFKILWIFI